MAQDKSYIIEFRKVGKALKVSAIDPDTLTEVSIIGPATAGKEELSRIAVKKLEYVMAKKSKSGA